MEVEQMRGGICDGRIENSVFLFHCRVWVVGERPGPRRTRAPDSGKRA